MGNVPPSLLKTGSPQAVAENCHDLIETVGPEVLILSPGARRIGRRNRTWKR